MTGKCHLSSDRVLTSVRKKSGAPERVSKSRVKVSHRSVVPSSSPSMQTEIGYGNQLAKPSSHHTVKTTTTCGVHLGKVERHPRGYEKEREREKPKANSATSKVQSSARYRVLLHKMARSKSFNFSISLKSFHHHHYHQPTHHRHRFLKTVLHHYHHQPKTYFVFSSCFHQHRRLRLLHSSSPVPSSSSTSVINTH